MFFQIDVKTDEVAIPALEIIKKCNAIDRVCIASFNSKRLNNIYKNYPEVCLSMGPIEVFKLLLASFNLYSKDIQGDCLQVPIYQYGFIKIVTQRFVKYVQNRGLKISVWTINDPKTLKKLIDMKVDGIITDKPKLLMELLEN
jgi:glycerophosphoryl diester phosphodiesterase